MADPLFASVRLLLHFEGANGSTATIDSAQTPNTVTPNGTAQISTAQAKFGTSSAIFTGAASSYYAVSDSANLTISADYTFDFWVYPTNIGAQRFMFGVTSPRIYMIIESAGTVSGFAGITRTSTATISANQWLHFAVVRASGNIQFYLNGTAFGAPIGSAATFDPSTGIFVGSDSFNPGIIGYIDAFRLTAAARWTANFTPPASIDEYLSDLPPSPISGNFGWTGYQPSFPELQAQPGNFGWTGYTPSFPELQAQPGNFGWTGYKPSFDGVLQAEPGSFGWTGYVPSFPELKALPGGFGWTGYQPKFGEPLVALPGSFGWTGYTPSLHPDDIFSRQIIQRRFYCLLGADSKEIPISSISGYYRADNTASFTVVCPDGETYISDILANINSYFKIRSVVIYSDGTTEVVDSVNLNIQQPSYDRGARSFSVTINGTGTFNFPQPRRRHILGDSQLIVESLQVNGLRRFRVLHMPDIYPNDSIVYNNVESVIGRITYTISPRQMTLELTEQG